MNKLAGKKRGKSIAEMLATPGIYILIGTFGTCFVEVEADTTCHQLIPETFARDGVLSEDGWNTFSAQIFGPLQRPS